MEGSTTTVVTASLSARRAWIEIHFMPTIGTLRSTVALRKESVDRNPYIPLAKVRHCVALRKESVDRNHDDMLRYRDAEQSLSARRAWIEIPRPTPRCRQHLSLSARRAWIEIIRRCMQHAGNIVALRKESVDRNLICGSNRTIDIIVALRKESVDRNTHNTQAMEGGIMSLSARRAWIEISTQCRL